jgi:hypothetical protein
MPSKVNKYMIIIGRAEELDFTEIALNVPSKIDTGAYRSAVHASNIKVTKRDGKDVLSANLFGHPVSPVVREFETTEFEKLQVRSSNGQVEERFAITLKIKLGNRVFKTSFSLADRSKNLFPVLIGRMAMNKRYLVDPSRVGLDKQKLEASYGPSYSTDEED